MNINWHNIRALPNDQKDGFEEFVCQLARKEDVPNKLRFIRKGRPDAGVECYWILRDQTEWAWQAKYFTSSLTETQWEQLDESVKTVLEKHNNVRKYYIAIPIDPPDARVPGQSSLQQKWDDHVKKWKNWAQEKRIEIDFVPWWSSDLIARLQKPENSGLTYFWFNKEEFNDSWFKNQVEIATADLGNRYSSKINFELDEIAGIFDAIGRDERFKQLFQNKIDKLLVELNKIRPYVDDEQINNCKKSLKKNIEILKDQFGLVPFSEVSQFDFTPIKGTLESISNLTSQIERRIYELREGEKDLKEKEKYDYELYHLSEIYLPLDDFQNFIKSIMIELFNQPYLLLDGEAGIGKSHLLADIANKRIAEGKSTLLLLGQHFTSNEDPWTQILKLLKVKCNPEEFLEALQCKAQTIGSRIIIFIDAINEGCGKTIWPDHLKGFIKTFKKFKWLGLVLSIRTSYVNLIAPENNYPTEFLIRYTHYGFRNVEYEASKFFFQNYNILQPSVPLLHPEFQNPLFLKLFCEGLNKAGYTRIPDGFQGITKIFQFFINTVNSRLSKEFNYSSSINLVEEAIKLIVKYKVENDFNYIPFGKAYSLIVNLQQKYNVNGNFIDSLVSEGIISKNLFWKDDIEPEEGLYITYERFEDHLIVSELLDSVKPVNISNEFKDGGICYKFIKDEFACNRNRGIIEALSIQLPEKFGKELYELVPDSYDKYEIAEAFVGSLLWRKYETIEPKVIEYINRSVFKFKGTHDLFWDIIISISAIPGHFFNADKIHTYLSKYSLPDRDSYWTQLIHYWYDGESSLKRLIDWAWSNEEKGYISDESLRLASIMLAWFLTSTNRRLRDSATKALVSLLENKIQIIIKLLTAFENVNDPYVYERLFAVAYGCAVRTKDTASLKDLSEYIYKTIFNKDLVYPHVLLRDYARGVIEYSAYLGIKMDVDLSKVRPPYKSIFPEIPSDEEIKKYELDYTAEGFKDYYWGQNSILDSMEVEYKRNGRSVMYGDFGRYVFQSNFNYWEEINPVDLKNIAIKRIFTLGYDVEKHGQFDRNIKSSYINRHYVATERIGKKYQWIAMHELLAQVSDKYKMKAPWSFGDNEELIDFEGPWEPFIRDIDPTTLNYKEKGWKDNPLRFKNVYDNWGESNAVWLEETNDFPDPLQIINISLDDIEWLMLGGYLNWTEPRSLGNDYFSSPQKELWYHVTSYLVKEDDFKSILKWARDRNLTRERLPEIYDRYELFNREYYWSPAFKYFQKAYYEGDPVRVIQDKNNHEIRKVIVTIESYLWEAEYDLSKKDTINILKPCFQIYSGMKLKYGKEETVLYSQEDKLISFYTSEFYSGYAGLLIKKEPFIKFLKENNYRILWIVIGEKNIIGEHRDDYGEWPNVSGAYYLKNKGLSGRLNRFK